MEIEREIVWKPALGRQVAVPAFFFLQEFTA